MDGFSEILNIINNGEVDKDIFNTNESYNNFMDSFYDKILSTVINRTKNDAGDYSILRDISNLKNRISKESREQYKFIISCCKEIDKSIFEMAFKRYNFLYFLKFVIRIIDIDNDYNLKVDECKRYFSNPKDFEIYKYLYSHNEVPYLDLTLICEENTTLLQKLPISGDLIIVKDEGDAAVYSLSAKGKNLYAFYMMKNINFNDLNYNEGKVNEVLEYLIQYISTKSDKDRNQTLRPSLNSKSANYNLSKLVRLLDEQNRYSLDFESRFSDIESESYYWNGGKQWKML